MRMEITALIKESGGDGHPGLVQAVTHVLKSYKSYYFKNYFPFSKNCVILMP